MRNFTNIADGTERWLGYRELGQLFGTTSLDGHSSPASRSTIERMVRRGEIPAPGKSGGKSVWAASVIEDHLKAKAAAQVRRLATSDVSQLAPDDIPDALQQLGARHVSALAGRTVAPDDIVGVTVRLNDDERRQLVAVVEQQQQASMNTFVDALARLDPVRAWLVAGGLFPVLRPYADAALKAMTGLAPSETPDELRALAIDIVDQALGGEFVGPDT